MDDYGLEFEGLIRFVCIIGGIMFAAYALYMNIFTSPEITEMKNEMENIKTSIQTEGVENAFSDLSEEDKSVLKELEEIINVIEN